MVELMIYHWYLWFGFRSLEWMIKIKIKGPNTLQDVVNYDEK